MSKIFMPILLLFVISSNYVQEGLWISITSSIAALVNHFGNKDLILISNEPLDAEEHVLPLIEQATNMNFITPQVNYTISLVSL